MNSWHDRAFTSPGDTKWHFEHSLNTSLGLWTIAEHELRRNILKNSLEQNRFWDFFFSSLSIFISSLRKIDEVIVEPSSPATVYYTQHLRLGYRDYVQSITTKRGIHVMFYDTWWSFNIYTFRNTLFFYLDICICFLDDINHLVRRMWYSVGNPLFSFYWSLGIIRELTSTTKLMIFLPL